MILSQQLRFDENALHSQSSGLVNFFPIRRPHAQDGSLSKVVIELSRSILKGELSGKKQKYVKDDLHIETGDISNARSKTVMMRGENEY